MIFDFDVSKFSNARLLLFWLDDWQKCDRRISITFFCITIIYVYLGKASLPVGQVIQLYSVLASTAGAGLGFVIAALTLAVSLLPPVADSFSKKTILKLISVFESAFIWSIICVITNLAAIIWPKKLIAAIVVGVSVYFFSTLTRTIYLIFKLNRGIVDEIVKKKFAEASEEADSAVLDLSSYAPITEATEINNS